MCGGDYHAAYHGRPYCITHYSRVTRSADDSPGPIDRIRRHADACARCGGAFRRHVAGVPLCEPCSWKERYRADRERERRRSRTYHQRHRDRLQGKRSSRLKRRRKEPGFRDKERATQAAWRARNRGKKRGQAARRVARTGGVVSASTLRFLLTDPCAYCGGEATSIDHIVPLVLGGEHHWSNLAPACARCNSQKRDRPLLVFLATR